MDRLAPADQLLASFAVRTEAERAKLQATALDILRDPGLRRVLGPGTEWWRVMKLVLSEGFVITPQQMLGDLQTLAELRTLADFVAPEKGL